MAASSRRRLVSLNVQGTHKIHSEAKALLISPSYGVKDYCFHKNYATFPANEATAARVDLKRHFGLAREGKDEVGIGAFIDKERRLKKSLFHYIISTLNYFTNSTDN